MDRKDVPNASAALPALREREGSGHSPERRPHTLFHLDSPGPTAFPRGAPGGTLWTGTAERSLEDWQGLMTAELSPKQCTWVNEHSKDGRTWTRFGEGRRTKP